jgi:hypothetical protein
MFCGRRLERSGIKPDAPIAAFVKRLRCSKCGSASVMVGWLSPESIADLPDVSLLRSPMAKAAMPKKTAKLSKQEQYGRFQQTARDLGVDNEESAIVFEIAFEKLVPPKKATRKGALTRRS